MLHLENSKLCPPVCTQGGTVLCLICDLGALSWGTHGLSSNVLGFSASSLCLGNLHFPPRELNHKGSKQGLGTGHHRYLGGGEHRTIKKQGSSLLGHPNLPKALEISINNSLPVGTLSSEDGLDGDCRERLGVRGQAREREDIAGTVGC